MADAAAASSTAVPAKNAGRGSNEPTFGELRTFQKAIELAAAGGATALASKIVLIGQESSAKSATISALVPGLHLMSGAGSTTKLPTLINASHAKTGHAEVTLSAKVKDKVESITLKNHDLEDKLKLSTAFKKLQDMVVDSDPHAASGYSMVEIHLDVRLPGCANISIVDLPGHVASYGKAEERTREIIEKYLAEPNSIPVVLVPCSTNPSSTSLLGLLATYEFGEISGESMEIFSPGSRCFYIRSKGDSASEDELKVILRQAAAEPGKVFITASMPGGKPLESPADELRVLLEKAGKLEMPQKLIEGSLGTDAIRDKLQDLLISDLRTLARPMLDDVRAKLKEKKSQLANIPKDSSDLRKVSSAFGESMQDVLRRPAPGGTDSLAMQAFELVHSFELELQGETLDFVGSVDWEKSRRKHVSRLQESGQAIDERVISELADKVSFKARNLARSLTEELIALIGDGLHAAIGQYEAEAPCLLRLARREFSDQLCEMKEQVLEDIEEATKASRSFAPSASVMMQWPDAGESDLSEVVDHMTDVVASTVDTMFSEGEVLDQAEAQHLRRSRRWREEAAARLRKGAMTCLARKLGSDHKAAARLSPEDDLLRQAKMRASIFGLRVHRTLVDCVLGGLESFIQVTDYSQYVEMDDAKVARLNHRRSQLGEQLDHLNGAEKRLSELLPWCDEDEFFDGAAGTSTPALPAAAAAAGGPADAEPLH